jgi:endo-1,4-beta-xylanase
MIKPNRPRLFGLLLCIVAASTAQATSLTPRSGWVFVPGAGDMIQAGQWGCTAGVTLGGGRLGASDTLSITAPSSGYSTPINTTGPQLQVQGDFSVLATLSDPGGAGAFLTLVGTLATGSEYWSGLKRLDVGFYNGAILANYWTGSSANPTSQSYALPAGASDQINLEVARIGTNITVFVNGSQIGSFADPGLFASGQVYFGFNVAPGNTLNVLALAAAMPSGSSTSLFVPDSQIATRTSTALRDSAAPSGLLVGAASDPELFPMTSYAQALGREFDFIVPENDLKFAQTEPAAHVFSFCAGDQLVTFAQGNGMKMRGHNLVWWLYLPDWLTNGNYSSAEASSILQEHINTVMGHFQGELVDWDVVNEAISDTAPYGLKPSYWLTQLGDNYVDMAFQWAHAADPNAKLFYNDYGGEGLGGKSDGIYSYVQGMLSRGIPINGVGLQMHVTLDNAPSESDISTNMARLGALGLEVHISEMDVRMAVDSNGNASAADLASQAVIYQNVVSACLANSNCTAFLTWGITDLYSWIPSTYPGFGAGLLLDQQYNPKPAYTSVSTALRSAATTQPVIYPNGIVIHAGASAPVSPGSLGDIYGTNLAVAPATTQGVPLATTLGNVQVTVNGTPAPLYYVSPGQVDFQIPYSVAPGSALVQVTSNGTAGRSAAITVQPAAPSILTYVDGSGNTRAVVQNQDYTINSATNCAAPGSYLTAYLIGSGPLNHPIPTGAAAPSSPLSSETLTTTATMGTTAATVTFAGMAPGFVGLMQVDLQAPNVSGDLPLQIQVGTFASNQGLVCVGK